MTRDTSIPVIKAKQLTAKYKDKIVWEDADFEIYSSQFSVILGPNGAGKSTLFRMLLGLIDSSRGELEVLGDEPKKMNRFIGYIPQRRNITNQTTLAAKELVRLGLNGYKLGLNLNHHQVETKINHVLKLVDALSLANKPLGQLSGGELQRIFLAQALIDDPKILLLDEPLVNLDFRREHELIGLIKKLAIERNITVLLIAHDLNPLLPYIDNVIYVANRQIASGNVEQILTSEMLTRLYKSPIEVLKDSSGRLVIVGTTGGVHHE